MKIILSVPQLDEGTYFVPPGKGTVWRVIGYELKNPNDPHIVLESVEEDEGDNTINK